jgi:hypothetical protein
VPAVRSTQGVDPDTSVQRFRFVAGAPDGRKVALLLSNFGPTSLAPFVNLHAYEAGAAVGFYSRNQFAPGPPLDEGVLAQLEASLVAESAEDLTDAGLVAGENLPRALPWCQSGDTVYVDEGGAAPRAYALRVDAQPCAAPDQPPRTRWSLCDEVEPAACIVEARGNAAESECLGGELTLVDVLRTASGPWAVAQRRVPTAGGAVIVLRSLGSAAPASARAGRAD